MTLDSIFNGNDSLLHLSFSKALEGRVLEIFSFDILNICVLVCGSLVEFLDSSESVIFYNIVAVRIESQGI